ncbi:hypothetical protein [Pseudomonas sp. A2]|uniref:hypothetical protein n=1 Tax=Pseudomonas sp. A2 TaxID=107445 RepID=UPI001FFFE3B1|nr:hypothetical protein [Pseudomonas sp. A2]UPK87341.1 hypothetical protein E5221_21240 [Pseudomonas sp. A2]
MNSATATATMARPTAQVLDFNAAALAAYKRRQAAGKTEVMLPGNPLLAYAKAQPGEVVISIDWIEEQLGLMPEDKADALGDIASDLAARVPGGATPAAFIRALHVLLREAERLDLLKVWQSDNAGAPARGDV